jgi:HK97 family phage prohead protease
MERKNADGEMSKKIFSFEVTATKEMNRSGVKIGIIEGYASTFNNQDRGGDIVMPGCFTDTIQDYRNRKRQVRMYYQHDRQMLIGGYPPEFMKEDERGLFVVGEINLGVQKGMDTYMLAKQGVMQDLSIGFNAIEYEIDNDKNCRFLKKVKLWEISPVGEPMNIEAQLTAVKSNHAFQDLQLADKTLSYDSAAAIARIKEWSGASDKPNDEYKKAFLWFDETEKDAFNSLKLPIADIIDGALKCVPRAIFACAVAITSAKSNVPPPAKEAVRAELTLYYKKMGMTAPWEKNFNFEQEIYAMESIKEVSDFLKSKGFTNEEDKAVIVKIKQLSTRQNAEEGLQKAGGDVDELLINQKLDAVLSVLKS